MIGNPSEAARADQTQIALQFYAVGETVNDRVLSRALANFDLSIPANVANHVHVSETVFERDVRIVSFQPHMHYRGKSMRLEMLRTGVPPETLAYVPAYGFYW